MNTGVINFAVYENGSEYLGLAKITLPDMTAKTFTVNGAGIPGDLEVPIPGHKDAMTVKIQFIDAPKSAYTLAEERVHILDCRVAHEEYDPTAGKIKVTAYKHILTVMPKSLTGGDVATTAAQAISGEYSCFARQDYVDGVLVLDHDPANFRSVDASGTDRLSPVAAALGK